MSAPPVRRVDPLPYAERLEARALDAIELVVIHCTELPDLATAREYGERVLYADGGTGNSGHFYIDRDGSVHAWVPVERVAHHVRGHNPRSVGIELVNRGRFHRRRRQAGGIDHAHRRRQQEQPGDRHQPRHMPGDPGAQARTGQQQRSACRGVARQSEQALHARRHVAQLAGLAPGIEVGVVGTFMAPAQHPGNLRQGGDLGGIRTAFETVGEDAVAAHGAMLASAR